MIPPYVRQQVAEYYITHSCAETAEHFRINYGSVTNIAKEYGIVKTRGVPPGTPNKTKGMKCERHGDTGTSLYNQWKDRKSRCLCETSKQFPDYGGRGITIYPPWIKSYIAFKDYVTRLPNFGMPGLMLDRIDNDGNYEPGNVRWATPKESNDNKRPKYRPQQKEW